MRDEENSGLETGEYVDGFVGFVGLCLWIP